MEVNSDNSLVQSSQMVEAASAINLELQDSDSAKRSSWQKGKKRKKSSKDATAPRHPLTGYVRFSNDRREKARAENPHLSFSELQKLLGNEWNQLPQSQKQQYLNAAEQDKERYSQEMAAYRQTDAYRNFVQNKLKKKVKKEQNEDENDKEYDYSGYDISIFTEEFLEHNKDSMNSSSSASSPLMLPLQGVRRRPGPDKDHHPARNHFIYDSELNVSICCMDGCSHTQPGDRVGNLMRHLKQAHPSLYTVVKDQRAEEIKRRSTRAEAIGSLHVRINADILRDACAELITVNSRPFSIVEDSGFKKIVQPIINALPASERFTLSAEIVLDLIHLKANKIRDEIKEEIKDRMVCLKVDGVLRLNRCFLGIHVQFVEGGRMCTRTLGCPELMKQYTAENLQDVITSVLKAYDIRLRNIYSVTSDICSNMLKVSELLKEMQAQQEIDEHEMELDAEMSHVSELEFELEGYEDGESYSLMGIPCLAHLLELAVADFFTAEEIQVLIDKVRILVRKLEEPNNASYVQKQNQLLPQIDVYTRWHSTLDMLSSILRIKHVAIQLCPGALDQEDWDAVEKLVEVLLPARIATKAFEREPLLAGNFLGHWIRMKAAIKKVSSDFAEKFIDAIESREWTPNKSRKSGSTLFANEAFLAAVLLDPRYFTLLNTSNVNGDASAMRIAEQALRKLWQKMHGMAEKDVEDLAASGDVESNVEDEEPDELELQLRELDRQRCVVPERACDRVVKLNNELIDYMAKVQRLDMKTNVIDWWQNTGLRKWPILSSLGKIVLAVPMTQASVERLLSALKFAYTKNRSRLNPEVLENVLLIRANTIFSSRMPVETSL